LRFGSSGSRAWVEVRWDGLAFGGRFMPWASLRAIDVEGVTEPVAQIGDQPTRIAEVTEVVFHFEGGKVTVRTREARDAADGAERGREKQPGAREDPLPATPPRVGWSLPPRGLRG